TRQTLGFAIAVLLALTLAQCFDNMPPEACHFAVQHEPAQAPDDGIVAGATFTGRPPNARRSTLRCVFSALFPDLIIVFAVRFANRDGPGPAASAHAGAFAQDAGAR